jgi:hypothetical protein
MSLLLATVLAAATAPNCSPAARTTSEDYNQSLASIGVTSTRPGKSGTIGAPNQANNNEANAFYTSPMPEVMRLQSGQPVTSAAQWKQRRAEIARAFEDQVYGRIPAEVPPVTWQTLSETPITIGTLRVIDKRLRGTVVSARCPNRQMSFNARLLLPADAPGPVPVVITFNFVFPFFPPAPLTPTSPTGQLIAANMGQVLFDPTEVQADSGAGFTSGIIGLTNEGRVRQPNEWGVLRAWAWGASRVLDAISRDPAVDARRIGVEGLSRYGKAVLVTMAFDQRFAGGLSGSSGEAGGSPYRRNFGETLENVAGSGEYHWMAVNFTRYAGPLTQDALPVDANSLIALAAPRPLMVGAGNDNADWWVDPKGIFQAADAADEAWTLLGSPGLGTTEYPNPGVQAGTTGLVYRRHTGGHDNTPNYPAFIAFSKQSWAK